MMLYCRLLGAVLLVCTGFAAGQAYCQRLWTQWRAVCGFERFQGIAMDTCHKHHAAGQARFHGLEVRLGAQLITHDDLRVHAAQRHLDGLRFGAAGVDIAVYGVSRRQQLAALVRHAENAAGGIQIADDAAQESCFAAARRAYDQNPAIQGIQRAAKLGRQDTGHLARNAEIERCNIGKARWTTHPCHPHTAAAGQGEITLFQPVSYTH